ncbi:MAG: putative molybdenum carrier protein [Desulfobacterales bacterium]
MLQKIMSSRLNAAGRAALDAAFHLAIAHGGWVSPPDEPAVYGRPYDLRELPGDRQCMEKCVAEADGTLLLIQGDTEAESNVCRAAARKYGRPFLAIDLAQVPAFKASSLIADWLTGEKIAVLNVAGPEADEAANTYDKIFHMITSAYWLCQGKTEGVPARGPTRTDGGLPTSVTAAVALLITTMPLKDRATLANMTAGELSMLNFTLGAYIRNAFGLWSGNERLLESCRIVSGNLALSHKEAAGVIVRELWRELGQTHKLRIVK